MEAVPHDMIANYKAEDGLVNHQLLGMNWLPEEDYLLYTQS